MGMAYSDVVRTAQILGLQVSPLSLSSLTNVPLELWTINLKREVILYPREKRSDK